MKTLIIITLVVVGILAVNSFNLTQQIKNMQQQRNADIAYAMVK